MTTTQKNMVAVAILTVAVRLAWHYLTGFTADDAFITFRYADNIANGLGFVYNTGERVLGTTTPFFTMLLAIFSFCSVPAQTAALFLSLCASALTAVIIFRFAQLLRFTHLAWLPVVCYIFWPRCLPAETSGMETALFTLLITATFYFAHKRLPYYALGAATLSSVTRPEGLGLVMLLLLFYTFTQRHRLKNLLYIPSMILIPWLLFCYFYFGSVIPNSITAKLALYSQAGAGSPVENLTYLLALHSPIGWVSIAAFIVGAYWLNKKQNFGRIEIIWLICFFIFYTFSKTHLFFWYVSPVYPIYLIFATAALVQVFKWLKIKASFSPAIARAVIILAAIVLVGGNFKGVRYYIDRQIEMESMHRSIGYYLRSHAGENDLVAAEDIGYMGYYSQRRILDRDGLVSPQSVPYNKNGEYLALILDSKPEWVVAANPSPFSDFLTDEKFTSRFEPARSFSSPTTEIKYEIYKAKPKTELDKSIQSK